MPVKEIDSNKIHKLDENLAGSDPAVTINADDLNVASSLAALSLKVLDAMANIYQLHTNTLRLSQNLDTVISSLNSSIRDFNGALTKITLRISDLEVISLNRNRDEPTA